MSMRETYTVDIAGLTRHLPLFEVAPGVRIAIFNLLGDSEVIQTAAHALAARLAGLGADTLITAEAKSIPLVYQLAVEMKKDWVILRKDYKPYMGNALRAETLSITTGKPQTLYLDEKDLALVKGKRVIMRVDFNVPVKDGVVGGPEMIAILKEHVAKKIGAIAKPDDIFFTADLPKTRSGKIMRRLLRDIAAGRPLTVRVVAKDNVGLGWVGTRILNAASLQIAGDSVYASGRTRDTTFTITIPQSGPQLLTVEGFARDRNNREGKATANLAVVDSTAPVVNIVTPADNATLPIGDALSVSVSVNDVVGIKSIAFTGVALRMFEILSGERINIEMTPNGMTFSFISIST